LAALALTHGVERLRQQTVQMLANEAYEYEYALTKHRFGGLWRLSSLVIASRRRRAFAFTCCSVSAIFVHSPGPNVRPVCFSM
jgi:hypothetical protein